MDKKRRRFYFRLLILAVLCGAIVFTIYSSFTKEKREVLQVGDSAPDFELVDMNGETHRLTEYKGQGVFLNFWGTWCAPCEREFPIIERYYQEYQDEGIQVLAVNIAESDFVVQNYIERKNLSFPVVIDKQKSVMSVYNINPLPTTFLINPEGIIEKIITGEMSETQIRNYMEQIMPAKSL
ncbi:thiol-disulfide oxidoreductase [Ureibacillus massiliensis 4400831 = CIP 108448 = CCUG 49529]|uniref:Thiol-disulfide oxidoreductase n=1 Tax=Ureibacillus massiliensis 4400831 = CIP 108448 = CCUG 49529 TaxID=1211035 RepID=A0A0A3IWY3_9BACL|nr:thiol-disulfide oxidoreductase ResA [Ureibacillus massiliensis]KGR87970.1 thiol-disulfide oxidoreductase [Ureibacillus massiliensis 4400831 = CIP 108448 = CCUG 49529]BDH63562.1 thiol-disulfide oxidoreductase ResA [Lysinibacillus sp. PLM2]